MISSLVSRFTENPVVGRQLVTSLTSRKLGVVFAVINLALILVHTLTFVSLWETGFAGEGGSAGSYLHLYHFLVLYGLLAVLIPLRVSGNLEGARFGRAFDQIVVTGVSPLRLHLGNWALGLYYAFFLLLVSVPYECVAYGFGGLTLGQILGAYGALLLYANVMIGVTLALSVVEREWVTAPFTVAAFLLAGLLSFISDRDWLEVCRPVLAEATPVRLLCRQVGLWGGGLDDPILFFSPISLAVYPYLLWGLLLVPCAVFILLGPAHRFEPGLNNFGAVVLRGDRKKWRFRRLRFALTRRVEVAFLYENRPRWCARWGTALRALLGLLVVAFLWGVIMAYIYDGEPRFRRPELREDQFFHVSFWLNSIVLFGWLLLRVDPASRLSWRHRLGPWSVPRGGLVTGCFVILLLGLLAAQYAALSGAVTLAMQNASGPAVPAEVYEYVLDWSRLVPGTLLFLLNVLLISRVFSRVLRTTALIRLGLLFVVACLFGGSVFLFVVTARGLWPDSFSVGAFLSPVCLLALPDLPGEVRWDADVHTGYYFISHGVLAACSVGLLLLFGQIARWRRRRARVRRASGGAAVLFVALLPLTAGEAQDSAGSPRSPLPLEVVEVTRGFNGVTFSHATDFFTIVIRNGGADALKGKFWLESKDGSTDTGDFELGRGTTKVLRWRPTLGEDRSWLSPSPETLVFEAAGERLAVDVDALDHVVYQIEGSNRPARIVVASSEGDLPPGWKGSLGDLDEVRMARCKTLHLPESALGYLGVGIVFVLADDLSRWTVMQRRALYDYARLGGTVLFCGELERLAGSVSDEWKPLLSGSRRRRTELDGGELGLDELPGGQTTFVELGEVELPILNVRSVGPGRIGHCSLDVLSARFAEKVLFDSSFWQECADVLPRGAFPLVPFASQRRDHHLRDLSGFYSILAYDLLYALVLALGLFIGFRSRQRRLAAWVYVAALAALFAVTAPLLHAFLDERPSYADYREILYYGSRSQQGVILGHLHTRSSGRQRHRVSVTAPTLTALCLTDPQNHYRYPMKNLPFMAAQELGGPAPGEPERTRHIRFSLSPWSARQYLVLGDAPQPTPWAGRAVYDQSQKLLRFEVSSDIVGPDIRKVFVVALLLPRVPSRLVTPVAVSPAGGKLSSTVSYAHLSARYSDPRGSLLVPLPELGGCRLQLPTLAEPRVLVVFRHETPGPSLNLRSEDLTFERELSGEDPASRRQQLRQWRWEQKRFQPDRDIVERGGRHFVSFRSRLVIYELPLTVTR